MLDILVYEKGFVMSHYVTKYYNSPEKATKLLIFLHGYNGNVQDIEYTVKFFKEKDPDMMIVTPEAVMPCEKNPQKRQWYSLWAHDSHDERRNPETPLQVLTDIYNRFGDELAENAREMNQLINDLQQETGITNEQTIIAGFSQGAMLACYTALSRQEFDGKCLMFSGVVAGADSLSAMQKSFPKTYLFHGKDDISVNYKTVAFSEEWLQAHGIMPEVRHYDGLAHKMRDDELNDAVLVISNR